MDLIFQNCKVYRSAKCSGSDHEISVAAFRVHCWPMRSTRQCNGPCRSVGEETRNRISGNWGSRRPLFYKWLSPCLPSPKKAKKEFQALLADNWSPLSRWPDHLRECWVQYFKQMYQVNSPVASHVFKTLILLVLLYLSVIWTLSSALESRLMPFAAGPYSRSWGTVGRNVCPTSGYTMRQAWYGTARPGFTSNWLSSPWTIMPTRLLPHETRLGGGGPWDDLVEDPFGGSPWGPSRLETKGYASTWWLWSTL